MENLNAEKIYKELAMFIEDMPTDLLGFKRTEKFREFLKNVLSLIKSQEQKIFDLENRIKECENGYEGTLHLDRCKLHDAEEKIKKLDVENKQYDFEQRKLVEAHDTYKEYAEKMQLFVEKIKHKEEEGYEPSAARYAAEMDMWRVVALEKKKLTEENERLRAEVSVKKKLLDKCVDLEDKVKADTVRKMHAEIKERCIKGGIYPAFVAKTIDQTAKEMIGEGK